MKKILLFTIIIFSTNLLAFVPKALTLQKEKIVFYIPHLINPKYFGFEFGFLTHKKISSYHFNAFLRAFIAEESYTINNDLRAGALGAKGGVLFPTQPWIPIYIELGIGFAKTALHKDPWFGVKEKTVSSKHLLLAETGLMLRYNKKYLFRLTYQFNNVSYFERALSFGVGVNF